MTTNSGNRRPRKVKSARSAYLRSRFESKWPHEIVEAVAFAAYDQRATTQRRIFGVLTLYFGSVVATAAVLEWKPASTNDSQLRSWTKDSATTPWPYFAFLVAPLAMIVATCFLYVARLWHTIVHIAMLLLHAITLGVLVASTDALLGNTLYRDGSTVIHGALYTAILVTSMVAVAIVFAPLTDKTTSSRIGTSRLKSPLVVAALSWSVTAIAGGVVYLVYPDRISIIELAIALGIAALVVGVVVALDINAVCKRITRHEILHGATYVVVDTMCVFGYSILVSVSVAVVVAIAMLLILALSQGRVFSGCGSCGGCGGCGCGGGCCAGCCNCSCSCCTNAVCCSEERAKSKKGCWYCWKSCDLLSRGVDLLFGFFCCCLVEELDGTDSPDRVDDGNGAASWAKMTQVVPAVGAQRGGSLRSVKVTATATVAPMENEVMER